MNTTMVCFGKKKKKDQIVAVVEYLECLVSSRQNI